MIYKEPILDFWKPIIPYILKSRVHSHTIFYRIKPSNCIQFRAEHTLQMELLVLFHPMLDKFSSSGSTAAHCEWWMKWEISAQRTASSQLPPVLHRLLSRYLICNFSERHSENPSESICLKNKNRMLQFCPWASVVFIQFWFCFCLPPSSELPCQGALWTQNINIYHCWLLSYRRGLRDWLLHLSLIRQLVLHEYFFLKMYGKWIIHHFF